MTKPTQTDEPLYDAERIAAEDAAAWATLPAEVAVVVNLLPEYARSILVHHIHEYAALDGQADAMTRWGRFGQVAGRIGAALEREEISASQYRLLMDYVRGLR